MKKTIIVGGAPVPLSASAGALIHYKKQFGTEYIDDYEKLKALSEDMNAQAVLFSQIALRLLWSMAAAADKSIAPFDNWVIRYEAADLLDAITKAQEIFVSALSRVKESGTGESYSSERMIAQALLCGLSVDDLDGLPLSMVIDTFEEWCKAKGYSEDDARPATQEDFDNF